MTSPSALPPPVRHAFHLAEEMLAKARRQAATGPDDMDRYVVTTGLPSLDALAPRWPGITLFLGLERRARSVLVAQIALKTAWAGKPVLWLCGNGAPEHALLTMMTRLARIERDRVFVKRDLGPAEWRRMDAAASRISKLPIIFGDVHGADGTEIEGAFCRASTDAQVDHRLVVIDRLDGAPKRLLRHLERLSDLVKVPFFLVVDHMRNGPREALTAHDCGLRPGSRLVFLERAPQPESLARSEMPASRDMRLTVTEVGAFAAYRQLAIFYDKALQRFTDP